MALLIKMLTDKTQKCHFCGKPEFYLNRIIFGIYHAFHILEYILETRFLCAVLSMLSILHG